MATVDPDVTRRPAHTDLRDRATEIVPGGFQDARVADSNKCDPEFILPNTDQSPKAPATNNG